MNTVDILIKEYFHIMEAIKNFDDISMIIKGWSITVGVALIGFSLKYNKKSILLVCSLSAICFMLVDAKYKEYQASYYARMSEIENCINVTVETDKTNYIATSNCKPLRVDKSWFESKKWYGIVLQFKKANIYIPHIFILLISLVLYFWWKPVAVINE